jgi:integrase
VCLYAGPILKRQAYRSAIRVELVVNLKTARTLGITFPPRWWPRPTGSRIERCLLRCIRNGLMVALLALCPIRLKNFADLEIGHTFKEVDGSWWIALPGHITKSRRPDERRVPALLNRYIEVYLNQSRPVLLGSGPPTNALWISSTTSRPMTTKNIGTLISKITLETLGVDVFPHLFRTAAASTAAMYGGNPPHLASALLNHTDPRVTEEHYNRASSMSAAAAYALIISGFRTC